MEGHLTLFSHPTPSKLRQFQGGWIQSGTSRLWVKWRAPVKGAGKPHKGRGRRQGARTGGGGEAGRVRVSGLGFRVRGLQLRHVEGAADWDVPLFLTASIGILVTPYYNPYSGLAQAINPNPGMFPLVIY